MQVFCRVCRIAPTLPKAGDQENGTIGWREVPGLLAVAGVLPFVCSACWNDAAARLKRSAKGGLFGDCFRAGVESGRQFFQRLLPPGRYKAPSHPFKAVGIRRRPQHHRDLLRRADAVVRLEIAKRLAEELEVSVEVTVREVLGEPAAQFG